MRTRITSMPVKVYSEVVADNNNQRQEISNVEYDELDLGVAEELSQYEPQSIYCL